MLRIRLVRRLATALLWVRRVRRCASAVALRRPLRHEGISLLPRWGLSLAGWRVALLRRRVAVAGSLRRRIAVRRRTVPLRRAIAVSRPGRPARREHRAARPAPRRRPRRREDDLASSLVRTKCTKPRRHGRLSLLVLGEGNKAKSPRLTYVDTNVGRRASIASRHAVAATLSSRSLSRRGPTHQCPGAASRPVWKSKFYGAFIDATPARWRGDAGSSPLDGASTAVSSPRNDLVKNYRAPDTG